MTHVEQATQSTMGERHTPGFALPTILISSIVMLIVLLASVTSTTAVRTAIKTQYYTQLAQVAGDAGVAYAKACLNANGGLPQWSNVNPLMPNTNCSGAQLAGFSCPSIDARCSVTLNGDVRSSFSIGMPPVDAAGKALTLPNTGFVEILRTSNGAVWRRYQQNTVPSVAVPDLCSGTATSVLGWNNAVVAGTGMPFPEATAQQITNSLPNSYAGPMYLRKDFSVTQAGVYTLNNMGDDASEVSVDGQLVSTAAWATVNTTTVNLTVGCHTIVAKLTNRGIVPNPAGLSFSLKLFGASSPLVVSDTTWRVTAGNLAHYSSVNYYADLTAWTPVRDIMAATSTVSAGYWLSRSGDSTARYISTTHSYDGSGNYPAGYANFTDNRIINITTPTQVKLAYACDDSCAIYLDGAVVANGNNSDINTTTLTLSEGNHRFGVALNNVSGPSAFDLAVVRTTDTGALTVSDATWSAANFWSATNQDPYSYDNTYAANPNPGHSINSVNILAVAGGGGGGSGALSFNNGGGGGGGGVVYNSSFSLTAQTYMVAVGGGGTANANGGNSNFNILTAVGGGRGGGLNPSVAGAAGGSGGGGAPSSATVGGAGSPVGQGYSGATGNSASPFQGGGGGGGAQVGNTNGLGYGGNGIQNSIYGVSLFFAGGGGGGADASAGAGGSGGGGAGVIYTSATGGVAGAANTGGGGGGGASQGGSISGGAGGSGIVIISYPTGSLTATGGTITYSGGRTIHTFRSSGPFTVNSVN